MVKQIIILTVCPLGDWPGAHCDGGRERRDITRKLAAPHESNIKHTQFAFCCSHHIFTNISLNCKSNDDSRDDKTK